MRSARLHDAAAVLALLAQAQSEGRSVSTREIEALLGVTRRTAFRWLAALEKAGLLHVERTRVGRQVIVSRRPTLAFLEAAS